MGRLHEGNASVLRAIVAALNDAFTEIDKYRTAFHQRYAGPSEATYTVPTISGNRQVNLLARDWQNRKRIEMSERFCGSHCAAVNEYHHTGTGTIRAGASIAIERVSQIDETL